MIVWQRSDHVVVQEPSSGVRAHQIELVAADHPENNKKPWIIVAHDEDWRQVGTFRSTRWVERLNPTLLYSGGDTDTAEDAPAQEQVDSTTPLYTEEYLAAFPKPPPVDADKPMNASTTPLLAPSTLPDWQPRMGYRKTPPPLTARAELLREAEQLITGERNRQYGDPRVNLTNIAALWNVQFGHMLKPDVTFTGAHVAQAMIHVKQARMVAEPKRDSYLDIAGYAACGWEAQANQ